MPRSYLPTSDADLLSWATAFSSLVSDGPETYGLTIEQAASLAGKLSAFDAAYQVVQNQTTRSPANIEIKKTTRDALVAEVRALVNIAQVAPVMDDDKRAALGITIRDTDPTPIPPPATAPQINVTDVDGRTVSLRFSDPANPTRRAKPDGVQGVSVFSFVGDTPPDDVAGWTFEGSVTKTSTQIVFPASVAAGSRVWFIAFWFNTKAQSGPASDAVSAFTQFTEGGFEQAA